jgi:hypothetical protein
MTTTQAKPTVLELAANPPAHWMRSDFVSLGAELEDAGRRLADRLETAFAQGRFLHAAELAERIAAVASAGYQACLGAQTARNDLSA